MNTLQPTVPRRRFVGRGLGLGLWLALGGAATPQAASAPALAATLPDAPLQNHDGRRVRLLSDVWGDRVALVNFVYTGCSSFCGMQSALFGALQGRLASRLGREVVLISITLDPLSDDPARLAAFARPFDPGPHWWWLTGEPNQVFRVLDALGADRGAPADHGPFVLVGQAQAPRRLVGLPSLAQLQAAVERELRA